MLILLLLRCVGRCCDRADSAGRTRCRCCMSGGDAVVGRGAIVLRLLDGRGCRCCVSGVDLLSDVVAIVLRLRVRVGRGRCCMSGVDAVVGR